MAPRRIVAPVLIIIKLPKPILKNAYAPTQLKNKHCKELQRFVLVLSKLFKLYSKKFIYSFFKNPKRKNKHCKELQRLCLYYQNFPNSIQKKLFTCLSEKEKINTARNYSVLLAYI